MSAEETHSQAVTTSTGQPRAAPSRRAKSRAASAPTLPSTPTTMTLLRSFMPTRVTRVFRPPHRPRSPARGTYAPTRRDRSGHHDRGPGESPGREVVERRVGLPEGVRRDRRPHLEAPGEREQLLAVGPGVG